jgi:hypothetical protein
MTRLVRSVHSVGKLQSSNRLDLDYEQQRRDLLHKHGIDLEDGNAPQTGTKRMDRKDVERIMGGGDETGGVFTWREKNRKKVRSPYTRRRSVRANLLAIPQLAYSV